MMAEYQRINLTKFPLPDPLTNIEIGIWTEPIPDSQATEN